MEPRGEFPAGGGPEQLDAYIDRAIDALFVPMTAPAPTESSERSPDDLDDTGRVAPAEQSVAGDGFLAGWKESLLSLDWEVSAENIHRFQTEVESVGAALGGLPGAQTVVKMVAVVCKYLLAAGDKASPFSVQFLHESTRTLDHLTQDPPPEPREYEAAMGRLQNSYRRLKADALRTQPKTGRRAGRPEEAAATAPTATERKSAQPHDSGPVEAPPDPDRSPSLAQEGAQPMEASPIPEASEPLEPPAELEVLREVGPEDLPSLPPASASSEASALADPGEQAEVAAVVALVEEAGDGGREDELETLEPEPVETEPREAAFVPEPAEASASSLTSDDAAQPRWPELLRSASTTAREISLGVTAAGEAAQQILAHLKDLLHESVGPEGRPETLAETWTVLDQSLDRARRSSASLEHLTGTLAALGDRGEEAWAPEDRHTLVEEASRLRTATERFGQIAESLLAQVAAMDEGSPSAKDGGERPTPKQSTEPRTAHQEPNAADGAAEIYLATVGGTSVAIPVEALGGSFRLSSRKARSLRNRPDLTVGDLKRPLMGLRRGLTGPLASLPAKELRRLPFPVRNGEFTLSPDREARLPKGVILLAQGDRRAALFIDEDVERTLSAEAALHPVFSV